MNGVPTVVQWVKDLVLLQLWLRLQLQLGFDPWPRNFHMPLVQPRKRKKKSYDQWLAGVQGWRERGELVEHRGFLRCEAIACDTT